MSTVSADRYVFTFLRAGDRVRVCWSSPWRSHLQFDCDADVEAVVAAVELCVDTPGPRERILKYTREVVTQLLESTSQ